MTSRPRPLVGVLLGPFIRVSRTPRQCHDVAVTRPRIDEVSESTAVILSELTKRWQRQDTRRENYLRFSMLLLVAAVALLIPALTLLIDLETESLLDATTNAQVVPVVEVASETEGFSVAFVLSILGTITFLTFAVGMAFFAQLRQRAWDDALTPVNLNRYNQVDRTDSREMASRIVQSYQRAISHNTTVLNQIQKLFFAEIIFVLLEFTCVVLGVYFLVWLD